MSSIIYNSIVVYNNINSNINKIDAIYMNFYADKFNVKTDSLSFDPSTSSNFDRLLWYGDRCGSVCQEDTLVLNQRLVSSTRRSQRRK